MKDLLLKDEIVVIGNKNCRESIEKHVKKISKGTNLKAKQSKKHQNIFK